jgi:hypothetical protein
MQMRPTEGQSCAVGADEGTIRAACGNEMQSLAIIWRSLILETVSCACSACDMKGRKKSQVTHLLGLRNFPFRKKKELVLSIYSSVLPPFIT